MNRHAVSDIRRYFAGSWALSRRIIDRRAGIVGRLSGHAQFEPDELGLGYDESGVVSYGHHEGLAHQSYHWDIRENDLVEVRFKDGRLFHQLDLTDGSVAVDHQCAADHYRGEFRVVTQNRWISFWQITGPRKDLTLVSLFRRVPAIPLDMVPPGALLRR
jgi:hypothetical protein